MAQISLFLGVVAIVLAYMCQLMPTPPRWWPKKIPWPTGWAKLAFALTGSIAVFSSKFGQIINRIMTAISGWLNSHGFVAWVGVGVLTVVALLACGLLVVKLVNHQHDSQAMNLAAALPFLVVAIPGAIGAAFAGLLFLVARGVVWLLHLGFG